jgi:spoIIIJ-associated protein
MTQNKTEVEVSAKTIDEAIVTGCAELGVGIDEVDFDIVDQGGIFRKMKVKITLKQKHAEEETAADTAPTEKREGKKSAKAAKPVKTEVRAEEKTEEKTHKVVKGKTDEFMIEGKERPQRKPREERPVTEFDPNAPKFVASLNFATALFKLLDESLTITTDHNDREFIIEVHGQGVSRLIGKEGHTMAAINTLVSSVAINHANGEGRRCIVDIENYREKRKQNLIELAKRKAEWVRESGRTIKLEPMPARERVIIHTTLQDMEGIETHSVGDDPHRCLVISPSAR